MNLIWHSAIRYTREICLCLGGQREIFGTHTHIQSSKSISLKPYLEHCQVGGEVCQVWGKPEIDFHRTIHKAFRVCLKFQVNIWCSIFLLYSQRSFLKEKGAFSTTFCFWIFSMSVMNYEWTPGTLLTKVPSIKLKLQWPHHYLLHFCNCLLDSIQGFNS